MIQKYYCDEVITNSTIENCIQIIDNLFESDNWCKNVPKYQTWPTLFEHDKFYPFAKTFLQCCSFYLNTQQISYKKISAWAYKSDVTVNHRPWHNHAESHLSGIFYLKNDELVGTEFKSVPGILPEKYCWYIFPSFLYHRPQQNKTNMQRYTLAADLYLQS